MYAFFIKRGAFRGKFLYKFFCKKNLSMQERLFVIRCYSEPKEHYETCFFKI